MSADDVVELAPLEIVGDGDVVAVRTGASTITGWTALEFSTAVDEAASTFSVVTEGVFDPTALPLKTGSEVTIFVGPDRLLTGYVDRVETTCTAEAVTLTVTGRSKPCDIVDCSAPPGARAGKRLSDVTADLLREYSLTVVDEAGVGAEIVPSMRPQEGEMIHDLLERIGRERGFIVTDDEAGRVVLTRAGLRGRAGTAIVYGTPGVVQATASWDASERYSTYEVQGQTATDTGVIPDVFGRATDPALGRFRRLVVKPEHPVDAEGARKLARWEAQTRAGKSFSGSYQLRGWRDDLAGELWRKNQLVELVDYRVGIFGVDMLIAGVTMRLDGDGRVTELRLAPAAAYELPPRQAAFVGDVGAFADELDSTDPEYEEGAAP